MTREEKELLLKDLSGRLPYEVKIHIGKTQRIEVFSDINLCIGSINNTYADVRPYLFPLSSMTEEQYNEFFSYYHNIEMAEVKASGDYLKAAYIGDDAKYSWLNKHHFDYRGLIPKGLALDATGKNIY
jgi:hypothetical protein